MYTEVVLGGDLFEDHGKSLRKPVFFNVDNSEQVLEIPPSDKIVT